MASAITQRQHRHLAPNPNPPNSASYGFPPPLTTPGATQDYNTLMQSKPRATKHTSPSCQVSPSLSELGAFTVTNIQGILAESPTPSPSSSTLSPARTPSTRLCTPPNESQLRVKGPDIVELHSRRHSDLVEYLSKNPMKRLYNNHGSIKRPACVACHESRKKCDLERPCNRCIKQKIPCVERPERAKRRKLEFDKTVKPDWSRGHSSTVQIPHGLPSPVSEACNETVPSTPITSYIPCPSNCIASPSSAEPGVQCEFPLDKAKVESIIREQLSKLGLPYGDVLELPLPEGGYLENISSKLSGAPIYGIEGGEITDQDTLLHQLVEDISMDKPNDANFDCKDALGFANMLMDYKFDDIDINAILGSISTEDIKNCMDNVNGDVLMGGMEDWELSNFMDALETTSSADLTKQSTILDPCATNWSVE